ncbi:MAG: hypothetical protein F4Z87_01260 [Gammaproteobacteria bacterium]|nr:hypothetical protein [Gammaproteobacteria bacterium]
MTTAKDNKESWFRKVPFVLGVLFSAVLCSTILVNFTGEKNRSTTTEYQPDDEQIEEPADQSLEEVAETGDPSSSSEFLSGLDGLENITSSFALAVAIDGLLATATFEDTVDLLSESKMVEKLVVRDIVQDQIFRKLASIDPQRALTYANDFPLILRNKFTSVIFSEWSLSDINAAIAFGRGYIGRLESTQKIAVLTGILESNPSLSESIKQIVVSDFELTYDELTLLERSMGANLFDEPLEAWSSILADAEDDFSQTEELVDVVLAAVERGGIEVLIEMHKSLEDRRTRNEVFRTVLIDNLAQQDIASAFDYAVKLQDGTNRATVFEIAENWARNDPNAALSALRQISDAALREHVRGEILLTWARSDAEVALKVISELSQSDKRDQILAEALWVWAGRNPRNVLQRLDTLPSNLQALAKERAVGMLAHEAPLEAIDYLSDLPNPRAKRNLATDIVWKWAQQDIHVAFEWLLTESEVEDYRTNLVSQMRSFVTAENVESLIELALKHSPNEAGIGYEGMLLSQLSVKDLELAKTMLSRVREGRSQLIVQVAIGTKLLFTEDDRQSAFDFGKQIPEGQRTEYEGMLVAVWATREPKKAFEYIDQLSTSSARSRAAMWLTAYHNVYSTLSDEQLEELSGYLTDREKKELESKNLWTNVFGF